MSQRDIVVSPTSALLPWPSDLRALSLTQPWATLLVLARTPAATVAEKQYETRSRRIRKFNGQVIVVHASKSFPRWARDLAQEEPFKSVLAVHGFTVDKLPLAGIVGVTDWLDCEPTEEVAGQVSKTELNFGNFDPGRFAYRTANPRRFAEVIPCAGFQGFWRVKPHEASLAHAQWANWQPTTQTE